MRSSNRRPATSVSTTTKATWLRTAIDLKSLGFDRGAHILVERTLRPLPAGGSLTVRGSNPFLALHLASWCRANGHEMRAVTGDDAFTAEVVRGAASIQRWQDAERAGESGPSGTLERPSADWGFAARGALVERGGPDAGFDLDEKHVVWADAAPRLYAQAAAAQWDPAQAIDWQAPRNHPADVEAAVVQVMTYLVENEQAALTVPARFLGRIHPHFREVVQFLAVQIADEARHMEVFARRAALNGAPLGRSTVGGRASLATLVEEPEFAPASFLLSVLGEGTFLNLLAFLERYGPDPVTREITRLARQDESRHVAFAMAHIEHQLMTEPALLDRLRAAIERRHESLRSTAGLNADVFDALVVLAAGSWQPEDIARGYEAVSLLQREMAEGRERRLLRLGFSPSQATELSNLHTRNFM